MATTGKVHMISGNNDHVLCGAARGTRTDVVAQVTCGACDDKLRRMNRTLAHLVALEITDAVQHHRWASRFTTPGRLRCAWLHVAKEKADAEVARLEESVRLVREDSARYAAEATEAAHEVTP